MESGAEEIRIVFIGGRLSGKSSSANTILRRETFGCGRIRTTQSEVQHGVVEGRNLVVVDAPGWNSSFSLTEIREGDKQRFRLNASKCPPGPNVFLLVIPVDTAFNPEQRKIVEEHMRLLAERAWKYTMVLFTYGDFLGEKTVEQHIESEGEALKWVVDKCRNRYHVFNNKDKSNTTQVSLLLEKIDEMVQENKGGHYEVDEQTLKIIEKRQEEVAERAEERRRRVEEDKQHMMDLISEKMTPLENLQMVLLGSRSVGKTSVVNTILGFKAGEEGKRTAHSVKHQGLVGTTEISVVDTPGWWKEYIAFDTPEAIKDETKRSVFLCHPGPHVFLLVIDADASFNPSHLNAVTTHLELLGDEVWKHTIIVFTRGDWLGSHTIEQYIEGEGEALQLLVEKCGNRYHVLNNKDQSDAAQVTELLDKITGTVIQNNNEHFALDEQIFSIIEDRKRRVEDAASLRQKNVMTRRKDFRGNHKMRELRLVMLGQKTFGKTTTGNNILRKKVFAIRQNDQCQVDVADIAGRLVTVIDTPGWLAKSSCNTEETDKETVRGLSLSPLGVHAILLVIPLDLKFREAHKADLKSYMKLFDDSVWKHAMVLFTFGDKLLDKSVEEHIEREDKALRSLVDKCENRYHVFNNLKKNDAAQVTELLEKIEEMVAGNSGRLFCPNMRDVYLRVQDLARRRQETNVMRQQMEQEFNRRKLDWLLHYKNTFIDLQADLMGSTQRHKHESLIGDVPKFKTKGIGQKKKDVKIDKVITKISQEIERLDPEILRCSSALRSSKEFSPPDMREDNPAKPMLEFLVDRSNSTDKSEEEHDWSNSQTTLNFCQSSGFGSERYDTWSSQSLPDEWVQ